MIGRPVISTIYCGDADGKKEFGSTSSICAFVRLRDRRGRKLWTVSAHEPAETAEDNSKDAFYDELNALLSKIASQEVVIGGVDANAKIGRTTIRCDSKNNPMCQENGIFGISGNVMERTSDSGDRLVNFREGLS
ncbi:hypothetical protein RB195_013094 [Necator americanus]|uniref:Uncharacterized protein n=1 Tax=Necator americanus TaxID=51031 RepID=A0ABR1DTZ1_NECAM